MSYYGWGKGFRRGLNCPAGYSCPRLGYNFMYGALIGVGVTAAGYYLYKKNQTIIDEKLAKHGINLTNSKKIDYNELDINELTKQKELIESAIANK